MDNTLGNPAAKVSCPNQSVLNHIAAAKAFTMRMSSVTTEIPTWSCQVRKEFALRPVRSAYLEVDHTLRRRMNAKARKPKVTTVLGDVTRSSKETKMIANSGGADLRGFPFLATSARKDDECVVNMAFFDKRADNGMPPAVSKKSINPATCSGQVFLADNFVEISRMSKACGSDGHTPPLTAFQVFCSCLKVDKRCFNVPGR